MADVQSNIHVNIDTSGALASLKQLQRQISAFHTQMAKSGAAASAVSANQAQNLMNAINATGKFQASMRNVTSSTESFTNALEKNKLSSREYFRYTVASTKTFGRLFKSEFDTVSKVARERVKDLQTQYIKMGRGANGAIQSIAVRPLTLDMTNLGTQTAIAAQKQQVLNQLLRQGSTNVLNFGKNVQWSGRQLMVGFTVPLVYLGTAAAKTFMKLEEQAIRFKRVYGEMFTTAEETDAMVKDIQLLASEYTKYGVAVEATMKMAADAAAQGKMGADLMAQVAQATRLAVLGGVEQEQALATTISVTNAFGVATEDLAKKIDFLNAVENQTVVSIEDLTIAMPKAGPVVQQLGGDVEDLAFFLTAMKEGGINASEGANALKSGLASLINPSEKASKMLQGLGINIKGIVEANKGDVKSTVIEFAKALDTLDPLNRARAIEQLFGKFQFSRLSTLFQNVVAQGTQASRVLSLASATTEELAILSERELGRIENTTTYKFKKSIEDLKVTLAPVGEAFLKALTPIVEFASKILEKFNGLGEGSKRFLTILTVALGAIGPLALMSFGLLANGVANIMKLFISLKGIFNKTGASTQTLGAQTSYMTQEQLEAAAVAASLNQVHMTLKQTFTSEATAVNALAQAYRNAVAAQVGFTGPVRGAGKGARVKKYLRGTGNVPGVGNKDTVPAMLTPGEAVIPAQAAQNPANRPVIASMIAGKTVQGFYTGSGNVQPDASERIAFAHAAAPITYNNINDIPDEFSDKKIGYQARGITKAYGYTGIGFDIPATMNSAMDKNFVDVRAYETALRNPESIKTMTANLMGPPLQLSASEALMVSSQIKQNLLSSLAVLPDGTKINDDTIYRRMGSNRKGILGGLSRDPKNKTIIQRMLDPHGIGMGSRSVAQYNGTATPQELLEAQKKAKNADRLLKATERLIQFHPDSVIPVRRDANGNIVEYKKPEVSRSNPTSTPTKFNNGALLADGSFSTGRSGGESGAVSIRVDSKAKKAALKAIHGVSGITEYGEKDKTIKDVGRSNPKHRHITGVYKTADGKGKVFVKPMINLENALAEQRAATILRDAHDLDVPEQRLTMVKDPVTKRLVYALESAFDPRFAGTNMPTTFSQDDYFKQLLASALRGDKDLGKGNLGGRRAPDVGTAYIYDEASQYNQKTGKERTISDAVKSVGHQALINVGGVPGSSAKKFFADATRDIPLNMSPDEYQRRMIAEIDRVLPKLRATIAKFDLTDGEAKPYNDIIKRLEDARKNVDWKKIQTAHATAGKVAITPDEVILNKKTKKIRKPKKEKLLKTAKSSGGSIDTHMITAPTKDEQVVKPGRPPAKTGKLTIRGYSDAPRIVDPAGAVVAGAQSSIAEAKAVGSTIGTTISQSAASASRTALYGMGPIDANAKSVRRKLQKDQQAALKESRRLSNLAANPIIPASVVPAVEKQTVRGRINTFRQERADKKAQRIALGKGPGMGMAGGAMAAGGVAMMASMIPGQVGEMATKIMMPLMGISMILPMLQNKFSALALGVGLLVAAYVYQTMQFNKAQDEAMKLTEELGSGAESIKKLSTFANKVSAGEVMDRQRKNVFSPFQIQMGKTTFGQSFVKSEQGKVMTKNVSQGIKANGKVVAQEQVTNQLATAVAAGALDAAQARSIVASLAQELGDYSFGIEINSKLLTLLGPNGENLLTDPLRIRTELLGETKKKVDFANTKAMEAGRIQNFGKDTSSLGRYIAAGAAGGGAMGAGIGATAFGVGALPGAVAGAGIGAIAATVAYLPILYKSHINYQKQIATASGGSVAMQKIALEQTQEMLDATELEYQKKLEIARVAGDLNKEEQLTKQYIKDRNNLLLKNLQIVQSIQTGFSNSRGDTQKALMTGADKAVTKKYKGTGLEDVVPLAQQGLDDSGIAKELKYVLKMEMASGQIDPMQMIEMIQTFGNDKEAMTKIATIVTKMGGDFANQTMGIVSLFSDPVQKTKFIASINTEVPAEAEAKLKLFQKIAQSSQVVKKEVLLNYYNNNPQAATDLQKSITEIDRLKGKITLTIASTVLGQKEMEALRADQAFFDKLPALQQKTYLQNMKVMFSMEGDPTLQEQYRLYVSEKGNKNKTFSEFVTEKTQTLVNTVDTTTPGGNTGNLPKETSKIDSSPLDELLKKLRDVRKNQILVTEGFDASSKALNKLFGGSKDIKIFSGIENDIRGLGGSEGLIEMIIGMDPKQYEDKKKKLFEFDDNGNIIKIKDTAKSISDAIASVALGDFMSAQQRVSVEVQNQYLALDKLTAAGLDASVALEAVGDAGFAAAVANKKLSPDQVTKMVKEYKKATKAATGFKNVQALIALGTKFDQEAKALQELSKVFGQYTQVEMDAIMSNPDLQQALVDGLSNPTLLKQFKEKLEKALKDVNVQMNLKKMTTQGMQDVFSTGMSNAMEAFDVQENSLRLQFDIDNKDLNSRIEDSQNQISKLQFKVGVKEAGLKDIEEQEERINETYDARIEALDEVGKANSRISQQQKGQLTLAEALTSGDIAAAARAVQDIRAQQAADAVEKQKEAMEISRTIALENVKNSDGKTRKELEKEIKALEDQIFNLEQKLNKDQEALRLKELALQADIEKITVLGKTRKEFELIANAIDLARVSSQHFLDTIRHALDVVKRLKAAYSEQTSGFTPFVPPTPADPNAVQNATVTKTPEEIKKEASISAADAYAAAKAKGDMNAAALAAAGVNPSALAAGESGAIGAASIASQLKAAVDRLATATQVAKNADTLARFKAKEAADELAYNAKGRVGRAKGGIIPRYFNLGGFAKGTDTVPAMLTPGEFIMSKYAVDAYGVNTMKAINNGQAATGSVYNNTYTLTVNAKTDANPDQIAQAVMSSIKRVDDRRIRGVSLNGR